MTGSDMLGRYAAVLARHLLPLVGVLAGGWSAGQFLVCAVFNTTWPIGVIIATNIAVSDRLAMAEPAIQTREIADLLRLSAIALVVALVLGALFGWIVVVLAAQGDSHTFDRALLLSVGVTIVSGLAPAFSHYRFDLAARIDEVTRKARDQPVIFALLASAAVVLVLSADFAQRGSGMLRAMAIMLSTVFIVRDLRPDLLRRWLPIGGGRGV